MVDPNQSQLTLPPIERSFSEGILSKSMMSIEEMYKVASSISTNWGIDGYQVPVHYQDPLKQIKDRDYLEQKKGGKNKGYITKKVGVFDYLLKLNKTPGPCAYEIKSEFHGPSGEQKKIDRKKIPLKKTFLEAIYREQEIRPKPGVGAYNLEKSVKEIEEELKELKSKTKLRRDIIRPNYLSDVEYLSDFIPGPGQYNPRDSIPHLKPERLNPKEWRSKHKDEMKKSLDKIDKLPSVFSYKPEPVNFLSFSKIQTQNDEKGKEKGSKKNTWGSMDRFPELTTKGKTKILDLATPGPGKYDVVSYWQGKEEGGKGEKKEKKKDILHFITKGPEKNIYYS